jgi:hypothetical protein
MGYLYWPLELTEETFEREVLNRTGVAVVQFGRSATTLYPAENVNRAIRELADECAGFFIFANVNADGENAQPELVRRYDIQIFPTVLFFQWGQPYFRRAFSHVGTDNTSFERREIATTAFSLLSSPFGSEGGNCWRFRWKI